MIVTWFFLICEKNSNVSDFFQCTHDVWPCVLFCLPLTMILSPLDIRPYVAAFFSFSRSQHQMGGRGPDYPTRWCRCHKSDLCLSIRNFMLSVMYMYSATPFGFIRSFFMLSRWVRRWVAMCHQFMNWIQAEHQLSTCHFGVEWLNASEWIYTWELRWKCWRISS